MAERTIEDKIFIKQCIDEYDYLCNYQPVGSGVVRRVPNAAMKGTELKELSVIIRNKLMTTSMEVNKVINAYKTRFCPKATLSETIKLMIAESAELHNPEHPEWAWTRYSSPFATVVSGTNAALRTINFQIEFIRATYKVADANDERWNKASVRSMLDTDVNNYDWESCWRDIAKIEEDLIKEKIDPYSPEYGKLIIKRLNSFKADIISGFNKYYGRNSVFAELNLSDMIR